MKVMSSVSTIFFIIILLSYIFLVNKNIRYKKKLDEKNVSLIQFYLDTKFLCDSLVSSLQTSNSINFCSKMIHRLKDYYSLEDIIVVDSVQMILSENTTILRSKVLNFVENNLEKVMNRLQNHNLIKFYFISDNSSYELYISKIVSLEDSQGMIICIEKAPTLLSKQELESLESCINLLKNRLIFG